MKKKIWIALSLFMSCVIPCPIHANAQEQEDILPLPDVPIQTSTEEHEQITTTETPGKVEPDIPIDIPDTQITDMPLDSNMYLPETEYVPVENIELTEFNEKMFVKETQNVSATVIPATATDQMIRYSSSNTVVATVSATGKVTAVGNGNCRIYASCGNVSTYFTLQVKVKTEELHVVSKYIVIKPGNQFDLEASVLPEEASQQLCFKSNDESVVSVSDEGILTAGSTGSTSVIISNDDVTILVNVIVSTDSAAEIVQESGSNDGAVSDTKGDGLAAQIRSSSEKDICVKNLNVVSSEVLKALYGTDKTLVVDCDSYTLSIRGQDIFNANNILSTELDISNTENGMFVTLNDGRNLPGPISISLKEAPQKYKYLYLVNEQNGDYQILNSLSDNGFKISSIGQYLLSTKNMKHFQINFVWVLGGICVILLLSVIYIFTKKKYWFW